MILPRWEQDVYDFVYKAHKGQVYSDNEDYFESHILKVVSLVKQVTTSATIITAAYLHDTLEDTNVTYEDLQEHFSYPIADWVKELTKEGYNIFPHLKSKACIIIKFADRLANLSRMENWDNERQQRYLDKSVFWKT